MLWEPHYGYAAKPPRVPIDRGIFGYSEIKTL